MKFYSALFLAPWLVSQVVAVAVPQNSNNNNNNQDPQKSLKLDSKVIATGFENDGRNPPVAGQVASLTSSNNFINFCLTQPKFQITNGSQIKNGSCCPAPMGAIPSTANMPSTKIANPKNGQKIPANTNVTISINIQGMETGNFVNAETNYYSAPQQLNAQGQIKGHSHIVIQKLASGVLDPNVFAFFKGLNAPAQGGVLTAVTNLPAGKYRACTITTTANHAPVLVAVAQRGSIDDCVQFTAA